MTPYTLAVPQARLDWIARRVAEAHVGYAPDDDADWKYGTEAAYLSELRDYWRDHYDWKKAEAAFNAFPQFTAEIDGVAVHFYHVRGDAKAAGGGFPIILTHGWPGSVLEFLEVIPLLAARGFDVVVPSLPGYGFSGRSVRPIDARAIARIWRKLMTEVLGYTRFGAQGGDWGAPITFQLAHDHADVVAAIHVNLMVFRPTADEITPAVQSWMAQGAKALAGEGTYAAQQTHKPQTLALALADTPIGFASWLLEKFRSWTDCNGQIENSLSKDAIITGIMTYLVSDNVQSSIWLYNTLKQLAPFEHKIDVPLGFAEFREMRDPPPRAAIESMYNLVSWHKMPRGGHFAAWEEPELFAEEVADFFDQWH